MIGLIVGIDLPALRADIDGALRRIGVGVGERGAHVLEADAVMRESERIDLDAHGRQRGAADNHLPDPRNLG